MIKTSPELLAVTERWFDAIRYRRTHVLKDYLSASAELRFIGTGEDEFWRGQVVRDGVGDFIGEMPEPDVWEVLEAEAFENGETGWSAFLHKVGFPGLGDSFIVRTVLVFVLEGASRKIINRHASLPFPNVEFVGSEQLAIQSLVNAALNDGPELLQTEGLASVLFTDVEGSTPLAEAMGNQSWSTLIDQHFQTVEGIVAAHRGQFVKSLGDGTLSSFQSANEALLAAIDMQEAVNLTDMEPRLGLRVGIHTGEVVLARGDFFGTVVNKAARITSSANAGEILVSDETRAMVSGHHEFKFVDAKSVTLKGLPKDHTVYRLQWSQ
ncbi:MULTISPECIES: adenylate/guanylate cyclase domain-containing protein [unclassified Ruegeria]|uniref:adenylate/guanylate cyclase domain-containing protein n=1 Tax=unclassified Ruegeria TaxID=2625375 RepID=UPI0014882EE1